MQFFHSVISVNFASVISICLHTNNLLHSLLFLSQSSLVCSLVTMLHHVLWLSVSLCTCDTRIKACKRLYPGMGPFVFA